MAHGVDIGLRAATNCWMVRLMATAGPVDATRGAFKNNGDDYALRRGRACWLKAVEWRRWSDSFELAVKNRLEPCITWCCGTSPNL